MRKINYTKGQKINGVIYLKELPKTYNRRALFQCFCGKEFITQIGNVRGGNTISCGCCRIKHGLCDHLLYSVWSVMKSRCLNSNSKGYENWGGRGIKVCKDWKKSFQEFYNWAIANGYKKGLTIERIDNNGNYTPKNCKFATRAEQNRNQRKKLGWSKVNEIRKMKQSYPQILHREIADIYGVTAGTIGNILRNKRYINN